MDKEQTQNPKPTISGLSASTPLSAAADTSKVKVLSSSSCFSISNNETNKSSNFFNVSTDSNKGFLSLDALSKAKRALQVLRDELHAEPGKILSGSRVPVLRLDSLGREIDELGNVVVNVPNVNRCLGTLLVNKRKTEELEVAVIDKDRYFDDRIIGVSDRSKRPRFKSGLNFEFVEQGKWSKDAEAVKLKSRFGEAQAKELKAKRARVVKTKDVNPNLIQLGERVVRKERVENDLIPDCVEWWDEPLLKSATYGDLINGGGLKLGKITMYVEHPLPIEPPAEAVPPSPQPLILTKKERKKLRTLSRIARSKDKQYMIRMGLMEAPKPKVTMSNIMRVLGSEATVDPTRLEMEVRRAAAEREQAHLDRSMSRKLTPSERREKKERKLFGDPNKLDDTIVSVYKIDDLSDPKARFKVDNNAQENRLTGCAIISEGVSVVIVEGGAKSIKRYEKLMLRRIDWTASVKNKEDDDDEDEEDKPDNKCMLVWQGIVCKPSFSRFSVKECRTEAAARNFLSDFGVASYWDLAVNFGEDTV